MAKLCKGTRVQDEGNWELSIDIVVYRSILDLGMSNRLRGNRPPSSLPTSFRSHPLQGHVGLEIRFPR